jgi:hypothetical protein
LIQNEGEPLILFVGFKSDGRPCYQALQPLLAKYADLLTTVKDKKQSIGAVSIILTGDPPRELIAIENPRYVALDGRLIDIDSQAPLHLIPTISLRWSTYFRWKGGIAIQPYEQARLNAMIEKVHNANRRIRFWSTPDSERVWAVLKTANVDWIGAERHGTLHQFLSPPPSPFERVEPK